MDKMNYPRGLIRYTTENALSGKPSRVLRVRTLIYATILSALFVGFVWSVGHRSMLLAEVIRDRNALWRPGPAGSIENGYTIKLVNKSDDELELRIRIAAPATLQLVGDDEVELDPGSVASIPLTLRAPAGSAHGRADVTLELVPREHEHHDDEHREDRGAEAPVARVVTRFFAPEAP